MGDTKPSRLHPLEETTIEPFVRAHDVTDCSVYWIPVSNYPMNAMQRRWLLEFSERLARLLKQECGLREEVFLHFKSLYPDLVDRFSELSMEFVPMSGAAVTPGAALPKQINMDDLREQVEEATRKGTLLDVHQWMPDLLYWFAKKKAAEQRQAFYGSGGTLSLFLKPDPGMQAPVLDVPRFVRTAPGFSDAAAKKMQDDVDMTYSLRDAFLAKSKEIFGERLRETPSYKGLLFVLPFFTVDALMKSSPQERETWFDLFEGYAVESPADKGVLFLLKDADFDEPLMGIVEGMRVPLGTFPLPKEVRPRLRQAVAALLRALRGAKELHRSVFLLLDQLHHEDAVTAIGQHAAIWQPEMGMGVRPEEPSPRYWSGDELLDREYSTEMPAMKQTVVALETEEAGQELACEVMTGRGALIQALHGCDPFELTQDWYTALQPTILEEGLAAYPLYVPVLSRASLMATSAENLDRWMGRAEVYVRESAEDKGLLIVSRSPLDRAALGLFGSR